MGTEHQDITTYAYLLYETVGHQFTRRRRRNAAVIRVDSELLHSEVVRPALAYLHHKGFEGPRSEFLKAHAHYRAWETKPTVTEANNAFECTLKAICDPKRLVVSDSPHGLKSASGCA